MKVGKLPPDVLSRLLPTARGNGRIRLGPGIGRDAAAIDMGEGRILVAASDPVTFATDRIGAYAVHVNANDVACLGAPPAFFLATVLLPEGAEEPLAASIFDDIRGACDALEVACIGGHTEVTLGLDRPIVAGTMLGETTIDRLVRPDAAGPGDHILLTKGIAIEGTALLARDATGPLRARGVTDDLIARAAALLDSPGVSVVREALIASDLTVDGERAVRAMHDATEGGLSTALLELGHAADLATRVREQDLLVLPETAQVCDALGIDPLGLLASGALLIAVTPGGCAAVCEALVRADITVACIGELAEGDGGDIIGARGSQPLPRFERDELARFFDSLD
jgi:hydrogenase expression/formation protein HypE